MEKFFITYDLEPWYLKRKVLWKAIQIPGEGVGMVDAWRDHSQLYRLMQNADQCALQIVKEETNCRRLKKQTVRHCKLIEQLEETIKVLEDSTIMYQLMH